MKRIKFTKLLFNLNSNLVNKKWFLLTEARTVKILQAIKIDSW